MAMIIAAVLLALFTTITCERVEMKIIEGLPKPKNAPNGGAAATPSKPIPSRDAKTPDPTTPHHMLAMRGRCFASNIGKYKYEVCPFENVTQLDTTARWNPFYGILGVWEGWKEDETTEKFTVGRFTDGTMCGSSARTAHVHIQCGLEERVREITEPKTCQYSMILECPELCSDEEREELSRRAEEEGIEEGMKEESQETIEECIDENVRLRAEIEKLRQLLQEEKDPESNTDTLKEEAVQMDLGHGEMEEEKEEAEEVDVSSPPA